MGTHVSHTPLLDLLIWHCQLELGAVDLVAWMPTKEFSVFVPIRSSRFYVMYQDGDVELTQGKD